MPRVKVTKTPNGVKDIPRSTMYKKGGPVKSWKPDTNAHVAQSFIKGASVGVPTSSRILVPSSDYYSTDEETNRFLTALAQSTPTPETANKVWKSWAEQGKPNVRVATGKRSYFNPITNNINITELASIDPYGTYLDELAHKKQFKEDFVGSGVKWLKDVVTHPRSYKDLYEEPGTIEYEAHKKIAPELSKKYGDVEEQRTRKWRAEHPKVDTKSKEQQIQDNINYRQGGTIMNKKVRITAVPQMGQGGYGKALPGTGNNINSPNVPVRNNVLSTQWQYINPSDIYTYQPNAYQTKKTLPRAEEGEEDIRIEKQEQVMGDFDGDGQQELMGVNSGSHTSGNDIGVSVPDGSFVFSDTKSLKIKDKDILKAFGEGEKPKTPAQIAKKYDLQKYKAIAANPDSDNLSKKTASMMYTNYQGKLSTLAAVQEGMKEQKQANKMMKQGGYYSPGGVFRFDEEPVTVASDFQYLGAPYTVAAQAPGYVTGQPTGPNLMPTPMTPYTPQTMTNPYTIPDAVQDMSGTGADKPKLRRPQPKGAGFNAGTLGDIALGLKAANLQRYKPWEPPVHAVVPRAVFLDPTRELAANSEQATLAGNIAGQYSNAPAGRSAASAYQGQALSNAANILSRYNNANVEIGNKANQVAAGITNERMAQQRERLKSMNSDAFNSQRLYQSELNQLTDELVKRQYQKEDKRRNYAWINKTNPYIQLDANGMPTLNTPEQRAAMEKIYNGQNPGSGGRKTYTDWYNYFTNIEGVTDADEAKEMALDQVAAQNKIPRTRTTRTDKSTGTKTTTSGPAKKFGGYTPHQLNKFIASRIG